MSYHGSAPTYIYIYICVEYNMQIWIGVEGEDGKGEQSTPLNF